jgi:hypothetical protein
MTNYDGKVLLFPPPLPILSLFDLSFSYYLLSLYPYFQRGFSANMDVNRKGNYLIPKKISFLIFCVFFENVKNMKTKTQK